MLTASNIAYAVAGDAGWSDDTLLDLVLEYVDNQGSNDAFEDFLKEKLAFEQEASWEIVGPCVFCKLELHDDGVMLIDSTGGDNCGYPLFGIDNHMHCRGFDPTVDDELVCFECLCHKDDHFEK